VSALNTRRLTGHGLHNYVAIHKLFKQYPKPMRNYQGRLDASQFNWALLRSFLAIYRAGSTAEAARQLEMQQPTVSRQLSELESQLAVTLFERTSKGLHPTAAAKQIYVYAKDMEIAANRLCLSLQDLGAELCGTVRIYASQMIATTMLPSVMAGILQDQPGLQLELVATDELPNLLNRDADIGFWLTEPQEPDIVCRKLGTVRIQAIASSAYLAHYGCPTSLDDLAAHRFIGHDKINVMLHWFKQFDLLPDKYQFALRTDDKASYLAALRAGAGIGFVSHYLLGQEPGLQQVLPELPLPEFGVWLSCHRDISNNKLIRAVYERFIRDITVLLALPG
jgi:DNA-binding transcriptional LysR family regulator